MSSEIHINDIGTLFQSTILSSSGTIMDLSDYDQINLIFKKPNGTLVNVNTTFVTDGTDGQIKYNAASGLLNEIGTWRVQGYIRSGSYQNYTSIETFKVLPNLE